VAGDEGVANWIADKLREEDLFRAVNLIGDGFLKIERKEHAPFVAAALGVHDVIERNHVTPLFKTKAQPAFVVNVPSKAIWSGAAIEIIHDAPAAFGTYGDLIRASRDERVCTFRNKDYHFFERALNQHSAVRSVTRVYDRMFRLHRHRDLSDFTVVLVDAYDMSAEDVRNARELYGNFDAALKMSSYGSVTSAATEAAKSMGAEAFKLKELMGRLNRK
jgi:hypothetical protein